MLTDIRWLSVIDAQRLTPCADTVVISILDPSEEHHRPQHLHLFADHLVLDFEDACERPGAPYWPDQMTEEEHEQVCTLVVSRAPELTDAQRIAEFVQRHHQAQAPLHLVVHCRAGSSRSAAVAQWAAEATGAPLPQLQAEGRRLDNANPRLLRLLRQAQTSPEAPL